MCNLAQNFKEVSIAVILKQKVDEILVFESFYQVTYERVFIFLKKLFLVSETMLKLFFNDLFFLNAF